MSFLNSVNYSKSGCPSVTLLTSLQDCEPWASFITDKLQQWRLGTNKHATIKSSASKVAQVIFWYFKKNGFEVRLIFCYYFAVIQLKCLVYQHPNSLKIFFSKKSLGSWPCFVAFLFICTWSTFETAPFTKCVDSSILGNILPWNIFKTKVAQVKKVVFKKNGVTEKCKQKNGPSTLEYVLNGKFVKNNKQKSGPYILGSLLQQIIS